MTRLTVVGLDRIRLAALCIAFTLISCGEPDNEIEVGGDEASAAAAPSASPDTRLEPAATQGATPANAAKVPLGLPMLPDAVIGYEIDRSSGGKVDYSGSFNTDTGMDEALGFYVDAITQQGGEITHDGRGDPGEFRSIQGTLSSGETFYISVSDLRDDKGYVQLDIKLKEQ